MLPPFNVKGVFATSVLLALTSFARMVESPLPDNLPGGLSSLCRIAGNEYYAVSDRGELVRLKIEIDPGSGSLKKCEMTSRVKVKTRISDLEAVCRSPDGRLFVTDDCGKSAYEITPSGKVVKEFNGLKAEFSSAKYNLGAEAMEFGSFGAKGCLWTVTELPRTGDGKYLIHCKKVRGELEIINTETLVKERAVIPETIVPQTRGADPAFVFHLEASGTIAILDTKGNFYLLHLLKNGRKYQKETIFMPVD
jgi:hypothetical protein